MSRIFLLFIFLLACKFCYSQYGWTTAEIYLKNGQVLKGQAAMINTGQDIFHDNVTVKYRENRNAKKTKFVIEEIDSLKFASTYSKANRKNEVTRKLIITKYIPVYPEDFNGKFFGRVIIEGKATLVGVLGVTQMHNTVENLSMIINKNGKQEVLRQSEVLGESFKKRATQFFTDCPSVLGKIESKEFKKKDFKEIVNYYNSNCIN